MCRSLSSQGLVSMKRPICGEAELAHDTRDVLYRQKDRATLVQAVTGDFVRPVASRSWIRQSQTGLCKN
ncbi:type II toxin-antitoxin system MqsA family antitoxin [Gulbenkiania indica]|uniref:type II toxin-antitoxin system MqsA family antitoxin n=1 Tax=Gulbenkiania indica TaxID=375574 RepID=UPI00387EC35F